MKEKTGKNPELPDLAWKSQTSFSHTSATTQDVSKVGLTIQGVEWNLCDEVGWLILRPIRLN